MGKKAKKPKKKSKKRLPRLEVHLGQIVGECYGREKPHYLCVRELTPLEKRRIVDFVNEHYRPKPDAIIGG